MYIFIIYIAVGDNIFNMG